MILSPALPGATEAKCANGSVRIECLALLIALERAGQTEIGLQPFQDQLSKTLTHASLPTLICLLNWRKWFTSASSGFGSGIPALEDDKAFMKL
jgi:hypothetical protein